MADNEWIKLLLWQKEEDLFTRVLKFTEVWQTPMIMVQLVLELLRNIKNLWWKYFVQSRPDMVGIDGSIISHHKIWEASGHVAGFADAMVDCKNCKTRMRVDHLLEDYFEMRFRKIPEITSIETA